MWKNLVLLLIGIGGGVSVAGGLFAFLTIVGVVTRLAAGTKTAKNVVLYEDISLFGLVFGNLSYLFLDSLKIGGIGLVIYGVGAGIFTGCLAAALAEIVNVVPVMAKRVRLQCGMSAVMVAFALGKLVGSLYQLLS